MKWLKKKLAKWVNEGSKSFRRKNDHIEEIQRLGDPLQIEVSSAIGGKIIRFHYYDQKNDSLYDSLYIISNNEDFIESFSKLVSIEVMKK